MESSSLSLESKILVNNKAISVGSGKSSLLSALVGDMLYFEKEAIDEVGDLETEINDEVIKKLKQHALHKQFTEPPITLGGEVSYVQQ